MPKPRIGDTPELMRRPLDTRLDLDIGREVALRDGQIRVLVVGRVDRFGLKYALTADILTPEDGAIIVSVREEAREAADVLSAIRRLAVAVRRRLGESLPSIQSNLPTLAKASTTSRRRTAASTGDRDRSGVCAGAHDIGEERRQ